MASWGFYGRRVELGEIQAIIARGKFFFCALTGRRRIGKTSLILEALRRLDKRDQTIYVQIPDSDERGVIQAFEDAWEDVGLPQRDARDFNANFQLIVTQIRSVWLTGGIVIIDEFQYFHRKQLSPFQSYLQEAVDQSQAPQNQLMAAANGRATGGMFTLGSIHTEMTVILEDKNAPLFNRVTDRISIGHWDSETLFEMFSAHAIEDRHHQLFLWSLFEGVPKFYRDCFDQGVLIPGGNHRANTLKRMFFEGSSPLRDEADNWFLRELRGRYDTVLTLLARGGPLSHGQLKAEYDRTGPEGEKQLASYLKTLIEKYGMIERLQPILSGEKERNARYAISDNFLSAWLAAISRNVKLSRIQPVDQAVSKADEALKSHEGFAFEKWVRQTTQECARKGVGDFALDHLVSGFWNKADGADIEIDLVAINGEAKRLRLGSCKRNADSLDSTALAGFEGHITRFLTTKTGKRFTGWTLDRALYAPLFSAQQRAALVGKGYTCIDLADFERWLASAV